MPELQWITTEDFAAEKPVDVFRRELDGELSQSAVTNYHVHFRRRFFRGGARRVGIRITADDYYILYVNGSEVCRGPAPAYFDCCNYNEADITEYLTPGENVLAVHVYYQGLINRVWNSGDMRMGLAAEVYTDGEVLLVTDGEWKYSVVREYSGEITGYNTMFLENIDFTAAEKGWTLADFDDSAYKNAIIKADDDHRLRAQPEPTLEVYKISPERTVKTGRGSYFIDFGRELAGCFSMEICGEPGQSLTVMCGEETVDGEPLKARYDMRSCCKYKETHTLSGGTDRIENFDYKVFRYVNVETDRDNINPDTFSAVVRHHRFAERLKIETGDERIRAIWNLCKNTLRYGVQEGFLDCPGREKGQYLGDFLVSGAAYLYITGDAGFYRKTLFDFAESARVSPGLMCVAPGSFMQEIADFSLLYPMMILNYYNYTGDRETVGQLYPTVGALLDYFRQYERSDGLIEGVWELWNMVDWPENLRDGYTAAKDKGSKTTPCHNVINAYYIGALSTENKLLKILGRDEKNDIDRYRRAYVGAFYNDADGLFYDTEDKVHCALHSNALAAFFELAPEQAREPIRRFIMQKGLCCGVWFSYFVLKALARLGAYDDEYALLVNDGEHSWINMLREGATTCFEAWGKEQKRNTSLCHPWACAPIIAIVEDLAAAHNITLNGYN